MKADIVAVTLSRGLFEVNEFSLASELGVRLGRSFHDFHP